MHLASIARERHCGRMEWTCLDWNQPSIDFYLSLGAVPMNEWTIYRLDVDGRDNIIAKLLSDKVEVVLTLGAGSVDQLVTPITEALSKNTSPASA